MSVKSILMHRELPAAVLDINPHNASINCVYEILAADHLPVHVRCDPAHIAQDLDRWFSGRAIPAGRIGFRQALEDLAVRCGTELSSGALLMGCRGLNLSDQYWVSPADAPPDWAKINFYDNPLQRRCRRSPLRRDHRAWDAGSHVALRRHGRLAEKAMEDHR